LLLILLDSLIRTSQDTAYINSGKTPGRRCANFGDDGCASGMLSIFFKIEADNANLAGIPGAAADTAWIDGGFTPGKRCANFGDDGCASGKLDHIHLWCEY